MGNVRSWETVRYPLSTHLETTLELEEGCVLLKSTMLQCTMLALITGKVRSGSCTCTTNHGTLGGKAKMVFAKTIFVGQ